LTFSSFNGRDILFFKFDDEEWDENIDFDWDWGNNSSSFKWRFIPNPQFYSELILTRSSFDFDLGLKYSEIDTLGRIDETRFEVTNKIQDISITEQLTWHLSSRHMITMGASLKHLTMKFNFELDNVNYFDIKQTPNVFSAFIQDKWKINSLISIQPGLRISKYELHDKLYYDPRIGVKYLLSDNLSIKGSWGIFNQFLFTTNDDDQILNIVDFWQPVPEKFDAMSNQHFIAGIEKWFDTGFTGSLEMYYKPYNNILTNNPNNDPAVDNDEFIAGKGRAWGTELLLKKTTGTITGWLGYSYSSIQKRFDFNGDNKIEKTGNEMSEIYAPKYSKPHSFNLVANYHRNETSQYSLSLTIASGQPYTPVVGKVYDGGGDLDNPFADNINVYGEKNSVRYPLYFRLDVGWVRNISWFGLQGKFKAQVMNLTNHFNVLTYVWDHDKSPSKVRAVSMMPFMGTIGLEFEI